MMRLARLLMIVFVVAVATLAPGSARAQRALPDDNLAYPVLVTIPTAKGVEEASGFYLSTSSTMYFVTAKHVLFDEKGKVVGATMSLLSYSKDPKETDTNRFTLDLAALSASDAISSNPSADVAVIKLASFIKTVSPSAANPAQMFAGVKADHLTSSGVVWATSDTVTKYADVLVGNDVLLFGYPTSIGIANSPQLDPLRPLLRKGIVAGLKEDTHAIILDCPVYFGNSGGPVVEVDRSFPETKFRVIGVVSQFVPFDENLINHLPIPNLGNSGYSIVTPMDYVMDLVK